MELAGDCQVLKDHKGKVVRLGSARNSRPIAVEFPSPGPMWSFIKTLNVLKPHGTYSRPFLSKVELERDRELMKQLNAFRLKYPSKRFVIHKKEVVEIIEDHYVTWYSAVKAPKEHQ